MPAAAVYSPHHERMGSVRRHAAQVLQQRDPAAGLGDLGNIIESIFDPRSPQGHGDGGGHGGGGGGGSDDGFGIIGGGAGGGGIVGPPDATTSPDDHTTPAGGHTSPSAHTTPDEPSTTPRASTTPSTTPRAGHSSSGSPSDSDTPQVVIATTTPSSLTSTATSTSAASGGSSSTSSGISTGAIVGIVAALGVVAGIGFWAYRRWARNRREEMDHDAALGGFDAFNGAGAAGRHQELHSNADGESSFHEKGGSGWGKDERDNWNGGGMGQGARDLHRNSSWGNEGTLMGAGNLARQNTLPLGAEAGSYGHPPPPPPSAYMPGYGPPPMGMGPPPPMQYGNMPPPPGSPGYFPPPPISTGYGPYPGGPVSPQTGNPLLQHGNMTSPQSMPTTPATAAAGGYAAAQQQRDLNRMPSTTTLGSQGGNPFSPQGSTFGSQAGHSQHSGDAPPPMPNPFGDHPDAGKMFTVVRTFEPNPEMDDELLIYPNDTILVLATFDDGWSSGVNMCHPEPRRMGVFPRDCIDAAPNAEQPSLAFAASIAHAVGHVGAQDTPQQQFDHPLSPGSQNQQHFQVPVVKEPPTLPPMQFGQQQGGGQLKRGSSLMAKNKDAELFNALGDVGGRNRMM